MALLADAGHNLSDVAGLLLAWGATALSKRRPTPRFTYGFGATSILAALANAVILLIAVGAILWEAMGRFRSPEALDAGIVMWVAGIGLVINAITAYLFASGREHDVNISGAFLHMAADAAVSLGVVLTGLAILLTGWLWLDPVISIAIALVIVWGTLHLAIAAVPQHVEITDVRAAMLQLTGVSDVHDLHIWPTSTTSTALTAHLVMPAGHPGDAFLVAAGRMLEHRFRIAHATLQIETGDGDACGLRCDGPATTTGMTKTIATARTHERDTKKGGTVVPPLFDR